MNQAIVHEIITDLLNIDPDLKNIKSELERLVQELIANKPETPFTKEFKDSLKAQIIGVINEQKILYEEKSWDWKSMFHSLKFWMVGISSIATCLLVFVVFQYFNESQQPNTTIMYTMTAKSKEPENQLMKKMAVSTETTPTKTTQNNTKSISEGFGGGAANRAENIMMLAIPESESISESEPTTRSLENTRSYASMEDMSLMEDTSLAKDEIATSKIASTPVSPTPCETSKQFLSAYNLTETSEDTTKTFTYDNQLYKATISFTNNNITINHIGTQDNSKIQTELPNLNIFLKNNMFDITSDYKSAIIETGDTFIEYYYPRHDNQEGITARIDKTTNIIFSIENICIH